MGRSGAGIGADGSNAAWKAVKSDSVRRSSRRSAGRGSVVGGADASPRKR